MYDSYTCNTLEIRVTNSKCVAPLATRHSNFTSFLFSHSLTDNTDSFIQKCIVTNITPTQNTVNKYL